MDAERAKNVVLIGLPGCGKTAVGTALAAILGRELLDLNAALEQLTGLQPAALLEQVGEARYAALEGELLSRIGGKGGMVVAAGEGTPTRAENMKHLWRGAVVVLLRRDFLSLGGELAALTSLFVRRLPIYNAVCDFAVTNRDVNAAAREIAARLQQMESSREAMT